jgi:hypothetical protein
MSVAAARWPGNLTRPGRLSGIGVVIYQHPLAYLLDVEGLALLRGFAGWHDRDFIDPRLAEIRVLLDSPGQRSRPVPDRRIAPRRAR